MGKEDGTTRGHGPVCFIDGYIGLRVSCFFSQQRSKSDLALQERADRVR